MYTKDLNKKLTLRLPQELSDYVTEKANQYCTTPSDFIRQCVASFRVAEAKAQDMLDNFANINVKELKNYGNDQQSNNNNQLQ